MPIPTRHAVVLGAGVAAAGILTYVARRSRQPSITAILRANARLLSKHDRQTVQTLINTRHGYIFKNWPRPGLRDRQKLNLVSQARAFSANTISEEELEAARLEVLNPPICEKRPHQLPGPEGVDDIREDNYYWLRNDERTNEQVLEHLKAETYYCNCVLANTEPLQEQLYQEMRGRIQEADETAPVRDGPYFYYSRTEEGKQYRVHCRRAVPSGAGPPSETDTMDSTQKEEVLLDENKDSYGFEFYMTHGVETSPDHKRIAYAVDTSGGEKYTLHVKELESGKELLKMPIKDTAGSVAFANDNKTLFYVTKDKLDRPFKVWRHHIGGDQLQDEVVYHEKDEQFYVNLGKSKDEKILVIHVGSAVTSETLFLPADQPDAEWKVILPRKNGIEYDVRHRGDHFFIEIRDEDRPNSEVLVAPVADPTNAQVIIPHKDDVKIESLVAFRDYLVVFQRINGLQEATIYELPKNLQMPTELGQGQQVQFPEPAYSLGPGSQGDYDSSILRLGYTSLTTPSTTIDYDMRTGNRAVKKVQPVLGGFVKDDYKTERLWATAQDGVQVPISLVYKQAALQKDSSMPMLLDGYGSYEMSNDPYLSTARLSLLDRGFVYAIAHVRGGGEMGRKWYENGKYLHKKNTFTDFIACAEHLIEQGFTSPPKLCIEGRSAGGLTMGAVVNMRPDLFNAVIMGVPFVDVLTTMADETIPLTSIEWEEWGNPADKEFYHYMKSYSPVDNIKTADYPNILVTAGLHDPRVGYWEPAKFVAKLRESKTDNNMLLFKCDISAGHFSQSGRFDKLYDMALQWAFLLKCQHMVHQTC